MVILQHLSNAAFVRSACCCATALVLIAGCGADADLPRSSVTVLIPSEPAGVNELVSGGDRTTQDVIDRLFLHLFEEQPDFREGPPSFEPSLAESWSWSDDRLELQLTLRDGVRWSDGVELTTADVLFTWRAQTDPAVGWRYSGLKDAITAMEAVDHRRLRVRFDRAYPGQLADLNQGVILPAHAWSRLPFSRWASEAGWFERHLVTSGGWRLAAWEPQQQVVLERNPDDHRAPPIDRLVLRVVPLRRHRVAALASGSADYVGHLTPDEAALVADHEEVVVRRYWHRQYDYIVWNLRRPQFADAATRIALATALDRRAMIDALWNGDAEIGVSPILASVWAHDPSLDPWPYDRRAASRRLRDAGWRRDAAGRWERDGVPLAFRMLVNTANPIHVDAVAMAAEGWRALGIDVDVERLDFGALVARLDAARFDAAIGSWGIDTSLDLGYAFHSDAIDDGYNSGGYANPEVDRRIDRLRTVLPIDERRRLLHELQHLLHRDQPYAFLWEPPRYDAHHRRLDGVRPNALSTLFRVDEWRWRDR